MRQVKPSINQAWWSLDINEMYNSYVHFSDSVKYFQTPLVIRGSQWKVYALYRKIS